MQKSQGGGKVWAVVFIGVSAGKTCQGERIRMTNLDNYDRLSAIGQSLVTWYQDPGSLRREHYYELRGLWRRYISGLVSNVCSKDILIVESFVGCNN